MLASLNQEEQKSWFNKYCLKRLTPFTLQDESVFYQALNHVTQQNYCLSKEEHELGVIAIAVPVLDRQGKTIAALNCMSQVNRVTEEYLIQSILPLLQNTAYEIRAMI